MTNESNAAGAAAAPAQAQETVQQVTLLDQIVQDGRLGRDAASRERGKELVKGLASSGFLNRFQPFLMSDLLGLNHGLGFNQGLSLFCRGHFHTRLHQGKFQERV